MPVNRESHNEIAIVQRSDTIGLVYVYKKSANCKLLHWRLLKQRRSQIKQFGTWGLD